MNELSFAECMFLTGDIQAHMIKQLIKNNSVVTFDISHASENKKAVLASHHIVMPVYFLHP